MNASHHVRCNLVAFKERTGTVSRVLLSHPEVPPGLEADAEPVVLGARAREALLGDGYVVARRVLDAEALDACRGLGHALSSRLESQEYQRQHASIGSLLDVLVEPEVVELITCPRSFGVLGALGFPDARFLHGIVFDKPPHSPPTFWHQDGTSWNHPVSYEAQPPELILIYYLVDTTRDNGCLRVIPGSHRRRHPLHDWLAHSRTEELRRMADPDTPAFRRYPEEVALPVHAGDVVILDARLLHAAHANASGTRRTALSLWYAPDVAALPECVRARFSLEPREGARLPYVPEHWPRAARRRLRAVLPPRYSGAVAPLPIENNPGPRLR